MGVLEEFSGLPEVTRRRFLLLVSALASSASFPSRAVADEWLSQSSSAGGSGGLRDPIGGELVSNATALSAGGAQSCVPNSNFGGSGSADAMGLYVEPLARATSLVASSDTGAIGGDRRFALNASQGSWFEVDSSVVVGDRNGTIQTGPYVSSSYLSQSASLYFNPHVPLPLPEPVPVEVGVYATRALMAEGGIKSYSAGGIYVSPLGGRHEAELYAEIGWGDAKIQLVVGARIEIVDYSISVSPGQKTINAIRDANMSIENSYNQLEKGLYEYNSAMDNL